MKLSKTMDKQIETIVNNLPKLHQCQYSTSEQLTCLSKIAVKLGLYDADNILKNIIGNLHHTPRYLLYNNKGREVV